MFECKFSYIIFAQLWGWQLVSLGYYVTKATLSLLHGFSSLSTPFDAKKTWLIASMRHFRSFQFHILFLFFCHFCFQLFSKVKSRVRQRLPYLLHIKAIMNIKTFFMCFKKWSLIKQVQEFATIVLHTFNPVWHEVWKQEKCSSLEFPRGNFYKTWWAEEGVKIIRLMSIVISNDV